jgi:hypothetical protein
MRVGWTWRALALREGSTVKPRSLAKILTAMIGLGLAATACSSTSSSSAAGSNYQSAAPTSPQPAASFLGQLHGLSQVASTVPANGDVNPYGVAVVRASGGRLTAGVPVTGNCTVVRLDLALSPTSPPRLTSSTVIGTSFPWRANKAALVLAPTGLALGSNGTLYVDDTLTDSVSAIPQALTRTGAITAVAGTLSMGGALNAPLGMTLTPNGDLVVVNGNDGNAVEITPAGKQVATKTLIKNGAGDLFGIITTQTGLIIANDGTNALDQLSM